VKRQTKDLPEEVVQQLKEIGQKLTILQKTKANNSKSFTEIHAINRMTLWRLQKGMDFQLSTLLIILKALDISPEEFFKGIQ